MGNVNIKQIVRENYAKIVKNDSTCCVPKKSCCGNVNAAEHISKNIGYSTEELKSVPEGANLGLGCGNPTALASLKKGETVLDLGSGAGFDCFLAANKVGKNGKVIGIDMTPEMIEKAKENAGKGNIRNVEFKLGEIEALPVDNNSVDVIISNCVINLSPDKEKVFKEAFRVLKPGGRMMVSDIVLLEALPDFVKNSIEAYVGCLAGAINKNEYIDAVKKAGFDEVRIADENSFPVEFMANDPTAKAVMNNLKISFEKLCEIGKSIVSIKVSAFKNRGISTGRHLVDNYENMIYHKVV
ncbi:MAG: arsenite methyltransferase [bacterium]